ncbi:MAG TPA: serine/threonine protein kinase, partial [Myxococcales bacterium]|nr:serine/threonine protein kinase [Myxococcales bacterium]
PQQTLDAVEATGLRCTNVCVQLNSFENRVYQIELHDGSPLVVKLYRPGRWSAAQIREEHQFLNALAQVDVCVCDVIELPKGGTLSQSGPLMLALFARQGGRAPEEVTMAMSARLGAMVARIHQVGVELPVEHRVALNADRLDDTLDWLLDQGALPADLVDRYVETAREIAAVLDERLTQVPRHAIHGDLHLGNLILRRDILHVLDFDDMMIGPACQDLWLLLPGRDEHTLRLRTAFLHGYRQFRDFDTRWLNLIEPLRGYRYVTYAAWLSRRWHDPMFPHTWPNFGTQKWWQKATQDLEDVLAHLDAPVVPDQIDDWAEEGSDLWDWGESR